MQSLSWRDAIRPLHARAVPNRIAASMYEAEQTGLAFALVPWPRSGYYALFPLAFFVSGYMPYRLRRHRLAEPIKLLFVVLDVALVTAAILLPPPAEVAIDWPVQTRLRGQVFLYLLLLLGEAALTYSPTRVLWTGLSIMAVWSTGWLILYELPDTLRYTDVTARGQPSDAVLLQMYVDPAYVSPASWIVQLVATGILTLLLTLAVLRSRLHLLTGARAEVGRSDLARYLSPDVADVVVGQQPGFGEPVTRKVAVLFADIVGFTGMTETLSPERTFALLRSFQERSAKVVIRHRGTLDKYIGDGLMATFGALHDEPDAAARALGCALDLLAEAASWNDKRQQRQAVPVQLAIGLHWGDVMVGHLGSAERIEFTVVGDVVNVASRLEKATRELSCNLVVSAACVQAAGLPALYSARTVELSLRGRQRHLQVHAVGAF